MRTTTTRLLACALLLLAAACASPDTASPGGEHVDNPGVTTEIAKPLASVNLVVPAALESCGLTIDKREFVDGVVKLEAVNAEGQRVYLQLSPVEQVKTFVEVRPAGDAPEGLMLQMVNAIRQRVWS